MKKAVKLVLALTLVLSSSSLFAQKFGRINTQAVLVAMPETKEMQSNLEAFTKDLQDNFEAINVEFNNKYLEYTKNRETYSDTVRQIKEQELEGLSQRREEFQRIAQEDIQKKQNELLTPIIEKAREAINKVAKANGYTVIFDEAAGALAYFDEATLTDIAPLVRKELGITEEPVAAK